MGKRPSTLFIYGPPPGGGCVPGTPPVRSMTGPACAAGCVSFPPGPMPGLVQPGACAGLMPTKFCRPVPGDRLDERTAGRHVCHACVIFVSFMNKSLIFRPGDRPTAKRPQKGPDGFLCYIYNIKI